MKAREWDGLSRYLAKNRTHIQRVLQAMKADRELGHRNTTEALRFLFDQHVVDESQVRDLADLTGQKPEELLGRLRHAALGDADQSPGGS